MRRLALLLLSLLPIQGFPAVIITGSGAITGSGRMFGFTPPTGGASGTFASDTFTGTNNTNLTAHTSDSGHSWSLQTGSSGGEQIQLNKIKDSTSSNPFHYISALSNNADYYAVVDASGTSYTGGPAVRMDTTAQTSYFVDYQQGGDNTWHLWKYVGGVLTSLGTFAGNVPSGAAVTVKVSATGTTIVANIAGVDRISVTDSAISAQGRAGLKGGGTSGDRLDNWLAVNP